MVLLSGAKVTPGLVVIVSLVSPCYNIELMVSWTKVVVTITVILLH